MKNIFMFDVESKNLHGEGFAFGAVVATPNGEIIDKIELLATDGLSGCCDWVKENVIPALSDMPVCKTAKELRNEFYAFYAKHKDTCVIWTDCNYPVETNFLEAVCRDDFENRQWSMPYPLMDVANFVFVDIDRNEESGIEGLRKHNPLDDSLASLACLIKHLGLVDKSTTNYPKG